MKFNLRNEKKSSRVRSKVKTTTDEIFTCPVCMGFSSLVQNKDKTMWYVYCMDCGIRTKHFKTKTPAIRSWNARSKVAQLKTSVLSKTTHTFNLDIDGNIIIGKVCKIDRHYDVAYKEWRYTVEIEGLAQ